MDVVALAFTVLGHLLASVLYVWRRIPFSSVADSVDRPSILEDKSQLSERWENRIMADEQPQTTMNNTVIANTEKEAVKESQDKKVVENGTAKICADPKEHEKEESVDSDQTDGAANDHLPDPDSKSVITETVANGDVCSAGTDKINHMEDKDEEVESFIKEAAVENNYKDDAKVDKVSDDVEKIESDACFDVEGKSLSDDEKAGKISDKGKGETATASATEEEGEHFSKEAEEHYSKEAEEHSIKGAEEYPAESCTTVEEFSDYAVEMAKVSEDYEDSLEEHSNETSYTSSFTFVCQKSPAVEQQKSEVTEPEEDGPNAVEDDKEAVKGVEDQQIDDEDTEATLDSKDVFAQEEFEDVTNASELETEEDSNSHITGDLQETHDREEIISETIERIETELVANGFKEISDAADFDNSPNRMDCMTPESDIELKKLERPTHLARLKPTGVQKTERPYDAGTTESKIAMEIREMREREEELKQMRERVHSPQGSATSSPSPQLSPSWNKQSPSPQRNPSSPEPGPGYKVSTVFGHKGSPAPSPVEEEKKIYRSFSKESAVEKEIRMARNREEELRKEKGLPPRDDDSYIRPSQVKSAQVRVFGKANPSNTSKELATTKIQQEIEEQTLREMALREKGHIQTISQERTDSKVAKLKDLDVYVPECTSPTSPNGNGSFSDRTSKRSTPSPTGSSHGSMPPVTRPAGQGKGISMQKFIASKGKETTFIASRNGPSHPEQSADASRSNPMMRKAKRTVSVESKIQQEILEMKLREEELRRMHVAGSTDQSLLTSGESGTDQEETPNVPDSMNGEELNGNDVSCPTHNNLIAQWERRIQKAEGKA